jgi:hypothetical protein
VLLKSIQAILQERPHITQTYTVELIIYRNVIYFPEKAQKKVCGSRAIPRNENRW